MLSVSSVVSLVQPYIMIESMIGETGELLFDKNEIANDVTINKYNESLDAWERSKGYSIIEKEGLVSIASYYDTTINILNMLLKLTHKTRLDRQKENERFIQNCGYKFDDIN